MHEIKVAAMVNTLHKHMTLQLLLRHCLHKFSQDAAFTLASMFGCWMVGQFNKKTFESAMVSQYLCGLRLGGGGVELTNLNCE